MLAYDYAAQLAVLEDPPQGEVNPHLYILCAPCADKLTPPSGWTLEDRRENPPLFLERLQRRQEIETQLASGDSTPEPESSEGRQLFFGSSA